MNLAVLGTDTGVGKTVVTAALVVRRRGTGADIRAVKPAQTGYPEDDDAGYVRWACEDEGAAVRLRTFEEPLAPAVAARRAGETIEFEALVADTERAMAESEHAVLEGAGGLRVPLSNEPRREIVDLVERLDASVLVVARSGLGTLNHSALTVEALRNRGIPVCGVVLDRYGGESVAERTNPEELRRMCSTPVWTLPERVLNSPADVRGLAGELPDIETIRETN